jgi:hypothetical protein
MINALTTAQLNGTLERALRPYTNPSEPVNLLEKQENLCTL